MQQQNQPGSNATTEHEFANLKPTELERLDTLVSDYLVFRSFKQTQQQLFLDKRSPANKLNSDDSGARNRRAIIQRILNAMDSGDYPRTITLWDTYIAQKIGTVKSMSLNAEARDAEFLVNIGCSIYPFRSDVIQNAGSPDVAAKVAARSMTMFKHYVENRGARLVQKGEEFSLYRGLFKIAFPPAHPQFKHLFSEEWYISTRERIIAFLEKFFAPEDEPVLCQLYQKLNSRSETELKAVFRRRERKLLRFSRSILTLSSDLLTALESGKTVEKSFLKSFRQKFDSFETVLQPDATFDDDMRELDGAAKDSPHGSPHQPTAGSPARFKNSPARTSPFREQQTDSDGRHSGEEKEHMSVSALANKVRQRYDGKVLEYDTISKDLVFVLHQVGDEVQGLLTRGNALGSADAVVICQTAMQGAVLLQGLCQSILRQDREFQPDAERNSAVLALSHTDVLGLRRALKGDFVSEYGSDGVSLESRSITRFFSLLASALRRIPPQRPDDNMSLPPYERLLTAAEVVAEYLCRLTTALGTAPIGLKYLHKSGVHLTIALATFLVALPLPILDADVDVYSIGANSSGGGGVRARSGHGICSWCIMALSTLVGACKPHQLAVIRNGGIPWLCKALGGYVVELHDCLRTGDNDAVAAALRAYHDNCQDANASNQSTTASLFELCLSLLSVVLESADAQRSLVGSLTNQRETDSLVSVLILLLVRPGVADDHAQVVVTVLRVLLREVTTRDAAREMPEFNLLKNSLRDGLHMSIHEAAAQKLVDTIASDSFSDDGGAVGDILGATEIMNSVWSAQVIFNENSILTRYIGGAVHGVSFLMRYSTKGSAAQPLFDDKWEPESQPLPALGRDLARFNDTIPVTRDPVAPKEAKGSKEMRSRPRIMRTPPGSQVPVSEDHGFELADDDNPETIEDSEYKTKADGGQGKSIDDSDADDEEDDDGEDEEEDDEEEDD